MRMPCSGAASSPSRYSQFVNNALASRAVIRLSAAPSLLEAWTISFQGRSSKSGSRPRSWLPATTIRRLKCLAALPNQALNSAISSAVPRSVKSPQCRSTSPCGRDSSACALWVSEMATKRTVPGAFSDGAKDLTARGMGPNPKAVYAHLAKKRANSASGTAEIASAVLLLLQSFVATRGSRAVPRQPARKTPANRCSSQCSRHLTTPSSGTATPPL
mmetsp:Transcript_47110/g.131427  ORF Transcript_47110/g.131427 Transcript_47110/m.131427 type:complete len:217 (+) Transcript_47110:592-1242(+)